MSPVNHKSVRAKLARLEKNISLLEEYARVSKAVFLKDPTIQGATLHYMVESIEIVIDIGNHLLADQSVSAENYYDTILQLGKSKIIPKAFATKHADMTKFRNLIVHVYTDIDMAKVYRTLRTTPKILGQFVVYFEKATSRK